MISPRGQVLAFARRSALRSLALGAPLLAVVTLLSPARAALTARDAKFAWDKNGILHGSFQFHDAINDPAILKKLSDGLAVTVVMRGYVYPNVGGDPIALTAHTCVVAYDLWNEVYRVKVNDGASKPVATLKGVYSRCAEFKEDESIVDRKTFASKPSDYYLAVKIEVDPISDDTLKKIQSWVTRPSGASGSIGPGDALFASFVGVFMKKVQTADRIVEFATPSFPDK